MINFFRKIRRKFADNNQFFNYSRYAVGEIVLVVIGILIALQINTWNGQRENRKKEVKILESLRIDFQGIRYNLESSLESYANRDKRLRATINYIGLDSDKFTQEMRDTITNTHFPNTELIMGTMNVVFSSDNLQLISSENLKTLLTAYPSSVEVFKEQEMISKNIVLNQHRPMLEKYFSLLNYSTFDHKNFPNIKKGAMPSDFKSLINNYNFHNILVNEIYHLGWTQKRANKLLLNTTRIIEIIESELKK